MKLKNYWGVEETPPGTCCTTSLETCVVLTSLRAILALVQPSTKPYRCRDQTEGATVSVGSCQRPTGSSRGGFTIRLSVCESAATARRRRPRGGGVVVWSGRSTWNVEPRVTKRSPCQWVEEELRRTGRLLWSWTGTSQNDLVSDDTFSNNTCGPMSIIFGTAKFYFVGLLDIATSWFTSEASVTKAEG